MTTKKPQDHKPKLTLTADSLKRPTKGVELCLDLGLRSEWEQAEVALAEARKDPSVDQRLTGGPVTDLAKKVRALEDEMRAATVVFELEALNRVQWSKLRTEHPPRKGEDGDKTLGFNEASLFEAAIPMSIREVVDSAGEPVEWDPESWQALADEMTNRQYEDFKIAVLELNVLGGSRLPKSRAASLVMGRTGVS